MGSELDLDLNAGREFQTFERFHSFVGRSEDVDESLVGSHLKLLTAVLVLVDGPQNGDDLFLSGERDGAGYPSAGSPGGLHDLLR